MVVEFLKQGQVERIGGAAEAVTDLGEAVDQVAGLDRLTQELRARDESLRGER